MTRIPHMTRITVRRTTAGICRHAPGDPNCSKSGGGSYSYSPDRHSPDADNYEIVEVERVGAHLVARVKYPNCAACAYEGTKVLVWRAVTEAQVLRWRRIDPHFSDKPRKQTEAPSPAARFPPSPQGWADALAYARSLKMGGAA